ncbi:carbohydrate kinase [Streptomyces sp. TLI_171]|uniref:carbohydrate kinase family protein n=1 Tax=Streptomyces sp. TLI_171 TaxID=1938859 RepID=UPI000C180F25|nr:carbohydrate kinase [Streptomyces sp. TLI_171]RKE20772.1 fructokinase [Streptomyces sp. TLI_171]
MAEPTTADVDFLVIGECVADIVRTPGRPDRPHAGGSPANVAYGLALLGRRTALLTQLGDDPYGMLIRSHLESGGVDVRTDGRTVSTPTAIVTLDAEGRASYEFAIDWSLAPVALPRARHVHLGSLASVQEPGAAVARRLLREARTAGSTVSYDPNVRPALFGDRLSGVAAVEHCVALSDLVKASDEDLAWLYPGIPVRDSAARWLTLGPAAVVVTRGGDGAFALTATGETTVLAPTTAVVDTVGAGDSFMSALLATLDGPDTLPAALRTAATAAAVTVSRAGANPPTARELAAARRP